MEEQNNYRPKLDILCQSLERRFRDLYSTVYCAGCRVCSVKMLQMRGQDLTTISTRNINNDHHLTAHFRNIRDGAKTAFGGG